MTGALLVGAVIAAGAPWSYAAVLGAVVFAPWAGLPALLTVVVLSRSRRPRRSLDVRFCRAVADELRGGSSLRRAMEAAADDVGEVHLARLCRTGRPYDEVAAKVEGRLSLVGPAAGAAIRIAGVSGGPVADAFETLALMAADEEEAGRERRAASAQVRASAMIIALLPVLLLGGLAATGRLGGLVEGGVSVILLIGGVLFIAAGVAVIWRMIRRAELV